MSDRPDSQLGAKVPKKFCASPWVEGVLRMSGDFMTCCKNPTSFGKWEGGVEEVWLSANYQDFRRSVADGKFPDRFCTTCYQNGTSQSLRQLTQRPLEEYIAALEQTYSEGIDAIRRLRELWEQSEIDEKAQEIFEGYFKHLDGCDQLIDQGTISEEARINVRKLRIIGKVFRDFLVGETAPEVVAPLRQSNLIAICNARCIHCPGLFTKEIELGAPTKSGERFREMSPEQVEKSFESQGDIVDFFMNGSELLFAKTWPTVAERLKKEGVRLRVSTNGMLLTEKNSRLLIDNGYLGKLNLSLDGASPEMIERVRARVKYDRVMSNLEFLVPYAGEKGAKFPFSMSFALMDINYHELPDFVTLAERVRNLNPKQHLTIMVQPLAMKGVDAYGKFVEQHHPSQIDHEKLVESFKQMQARAVKARIPVHVFFTYKLADFIAKGCPLPPLRFQSPTAVKSELEEEFP